MSLNKRWLALLLLLNLTLSILYQTSAFQGIIKPDKLSNPKRISYLTTTPYFAGQCTSSSCHAKSKRNTDVGLSSASLDQSTEEVALASNYQPLNNNRKNDSNYAVENTQMYYQSFVETIKCQNLMLNAIDSTYTNKENNIKANGNNHNEVVIGFSTKGPNLVAVTGETGSGKSLLVFKVFQLVLGEKVSPSIMRGSNFASGEVVIKLSEPHLSHTIKTLKALNLNNISNSIIVNNGFGELLLKRTMLQTATNGNVGKKKALGGGASAAGRFRSKCEINGHPVTLKALRSIAKPLITIVDAAAASSALSQSKARVSIIDTGVPNAIVSNTKLSKRRYREARKKREDIEREIENRVMPASFTSSDGEENIELLQHWISELDDFKERMSSFQESVVSSRSAASLLKSGDNDSIDFTDNQDSYSKNNMNNNGSSFIEVMKKFANCEWEKDQVSDPGSSSIQTFYSSLLDLRDGVKNLDSQLSSAQASCDALSSLSSSNSVAFALEESRKHLFDATVGFEDNHALNNAAEQSHELLNQLEVALSSCASFMSDDPSGLMSTIEKMRGSVNVSLEDIDLLIADWGSLARKHGVSPFSLPTLHYSLRQELDGNVEARLLLPKAKEEERVALVDFENACKDLSLSRLEVCNSLTKSVTSRLKDLGMEGSKFKAQLNDNIWRCTDSSAYSDSAILGVDTVDFLLAHRNSEQESHEKNKKAGSNQNKGKLDVIGSSGEKARLLLAIETDLPGSVGASCNSLTNSNDAVENLEHLSMESLCPVSVIYDEIDAHVGGNAAVSVAKLLADQTHLRSDNSKELRRNQVISITHSPSLAAIADHHIVIQKLISTKGKDSVLVNAAKGLTRLQEISRMASGDLAVKESIQFAEALLRDGLKYKESKTSSSIGINDDKDDS